ncbi:hypothetical protein VFSR5_1008 [Aliivibrio fischeri SR5]|uniref:Uncharacterized protein n=1 Tax=Aliivibrio fischeri SR5 TaxID=1088719 RepID=A0AAV3EUP1_ALIFS|nr:hypothetical protein VFSR5_1008 [Aliivibrio fischeri SR5]
MVILCKVKDISELNFEIDLAGLLQEYLLIQRKEVSYE